MICRLPVMLTLTPVAACWGLNLESEIPLALAAIVNSCESMDSLALGLLLIGKASLMSL